MKGPLGRELSLPLEPAGPPGFIRGLLPRPFGGVPLRRPLFLRRVPFIALAKICFLQSFVPLLTIRLYRFHRFFHLCRLLSSPWERRSFSVLTFSAFPYGLFGLFLYGRSLLIHLILPLLKDPPLPISFVSSFLPPCLALPGPFPEAFSLGPLGPSGPLLYDHRERRFALLRPLWPFPYAATPFYSSLPPTDATMNKVAVKLTLSNVIEVGGRKNNLKLTVSPKDRFCPSPR